MKTALLLAISNVFMTIAWYGHLRGHKNSALWKVVLASWLVALLEYCFQVPANREGHRAGFTLAQLKIMQEVITLVVFVLFSLAVFPEERLTWNYWVSFGLVAAAVFFAYHKW